MTTSLPVNSDLSRDTSSCSRARIFLQADCFNEISKYITSPVKAAFNKPTPPTINVLRHLPLLNKSSPGVYGNVRTVKPSTAGLTSGVRVGSAVSQTVSERLKQQSQTSQWRCDQVSEYYKRKHGTDNYDGKNITLTAYSDIYGAGNVPQKVGKPVLTRSKARDPAAGKHPRLERRLWRQEQEWKAERNAEQTTRRQN